jgi:hypothetical protein
MGRDRWMKVHAQDERVSKYEEGAREDEEDEWTREGAHFNYKVSRGSIN